MASLFANITPLALGSAVSPTLFTVILATLSSKKYPKSRAAAYCLGIVIVAVVLGVAAYFLAGFIVDPVTKEPTSLSATVDITAGIVLVLIILKRNLSKK